MAIFGLKKKQEVKAEDNIQPKKVAKTSKAIKAQKVPSIKSEESTLNISENIGNIIYSPRVTEKSGIKSQEGVYTFEVNKNANKNQVANAVKTLYKVSPIKVAMINVKPSRVFVRGKKGVVSGFKKAIVTLKKGDKIDFV